MSMNKIIELQFRDFLIEQAEKILNDYKEYLEIPTSISGKYHHGEDHLKHITEVTAIIQHLCDEFNIHGPENLSEYILCAADYIASRGKSIFKYEGK